MWLLRRSGYHQRASETSTNRKEQESGATNEDQGLHLCPLGAGVCGHINICLHLILAVYSAPKKKKSYAELVELLQGASTTAAVPARVS